MRPISGSRTARYIGGATSFLAPYGQLVVLQDKAGTHPLMAPPWALLGRRPPHLICPEGPQGVRGGQASRDQPLCWRPAPWPILPLLKAGPLSVAGAL